MTTGMPLLGNQEACGITVRSHLLAGFTTDIHPGDYTDSCPQLVHIFSDRHSNTIVHPPELWVFATYDRFAWDGEPLLGCSPVRSCGL